MSGLVAIGDFNTFNIPPLNSQDPQNQSFLNMPALPYLEEAARKYWSSEPSENRELIIAGSIEVIKQIEGQWW